MANFIQRTEAPETTNNYYYNNNPFYNAGYGMPNCTAYAWGRFWEISGTRPNLSTGDAENWWDNSDGYSRGQTPKLGAVACWRAGSVSVSSDGSGHVAIVEQINEDGSIITSNSAWGGSIFYRETVTKSSGYYIGSSYTFQGLIYNPVNFDNGEAEQLYWITGNRYLTQPERDNNAKIVYYYFANRGWSINAISGMLGNMWRESGINPGLWQNMTEYGDGFGLVQWSPYTKLFNWANDNGKSPYEGDTQCDRIIWELQNNEQWIATENYNMSFYEFSISTETPEYLCYAFLKNYERAGIEEVEERIYWANYYYNLLLNVSPVPPSKNKRRKKFKWVLYANKIRMRGVNFQ